MWKLASPWWDASFWPRFNGSEKQKANTNISPQSSMKAPSLLLHSSSYAGWTFEGQWQQQHPGNELNSNTPGPAHPLSRHTLSSPKSDRAPGQARILWSTHLPVETYQANVLSCWYSDWFSNRKLVPTKMLSRRVDFVYGELAIQIVTSILIEYLRQEIFLSGYTYNQCQTNVWIGLTILNNVSYYKSL